MMDISGSEGFMQQAEVCFSRPDLALFRRLHRFTRQRLHSARSAAENLCAAESLRNKQNFLHRFIRDCYDGLNGCAREVNLCMHHLFPGVDLYPPRHMSRQCGLYTVRKILRESQQTSSHPVSVHLWNRTREPGDEAYRRLSFLYNISTFAPLPLARDATHLPGDAELPDELQPFTREEGIESCEASEGAHQILKWTKEYIGHTYSLLKDALMQGESSAGNGSGTR